MTESADIIIVGAGIIGASIAYQLARRTKAKIIVCDKGAGYGEGSTGASSAVCRYRYTHSEMVELARDGIKAYQNWAEFLELIQPVGKFHRLGMLWMSDGNYAWPDTEAQRLGEFGVRTEILDDLSVKDRFPALNPCVVAPDFTTGEDHDCKRGGRHLLELDGGYFDPVDALQDLIAAARQKGADFRFNSQIINLRKTNGAIASVELQNGDTISCCIVINATGPWCNELFKMAGLENPWPLIPTRIQVAHIDRPPDLLGELPVCADPLGGIYFRTQNNGQQIIVGSTLEADEKEEVSIPEEFATYADDDFMSVKLFALQHRLESLDKLTNVRGYSGLYTVNQMDMHPIAGSTPVRGFYVANGFSGHGFKLAPAIGSLLAQQITGDWMNFDTKVDETFLSFDREPIKLQSKSVLA